MSQCCVLCTLVRPACRRSSGEPVASVDVPVVAEHASISVLGDSPDVAVERQTAVQYHTEDFHLV